jgi:hypothetical protein
MLKRIEANIRRHGFHLYIVGEETTPRFAYTIGLRDSLGSELILAGAIYYDADEVKRIVAEIRGQLERDRNRRRVLQVDELGAFTLRAAHSSWIRSLLLGALDYYRVDDVEAYQIVPDEAHWTLDTPNLGRAWSAKAEPVWQWLHVDWPYAVPPESTAMTNLDALRGARITEVARWGNDDWEMFAGPAPDVSYEEARVVPLGTLVAADPSLRPVVDLKVGEALWRDPDGGEWHPWGKAPQPKGKRR